MPCTYIRVKVDLRLTNCNDEKINYCAYEFLYCPLPINKMKDGACSYGMSEKNLNLIYHQILYLERKMEI